MKYATPINLATLATRGLAYSRDCRLVSDGGRGTSINQGLEPRPEKDRTKAVVLLKWGTQS